MPQDGGMRLADLPHDAIAFLAQVMGCHCCLRWNGKLRASPYGPRAVAMRYVVHQPVRRVVRLHRIGLDQSVERQSVARVPYPIGVGAVEVSLALSHEWQGGDFLKLHSSFPFALIN